jgi:hypothetical protein
VEPGVILGLATGTTGDLMTHIVSPDKYPTKKSFALAVKSHPERVTVYDPAIVAPVSGTVAQVAQLAKSFTVTNHPKRSWFAAVKLDRAGNVVVS